ncbi:hypothetical protein HRbin20_00627 [bacterium HR20]|nr:hypothetical protein HRbin20_00627 [bacterium HR20]
MFVELFVPFDAFPFCQGAEPSDHLIANGELLGKAVEVFAEALMEFGAMELEVLVGDVLEENALAPKLAAEGVDGVALDEVIRCDSATAEHFPSA